MNKWIFFYHDISNIWTADFESQINIEVLVYCGIIVIQTMVPRSALNMHPSFVIINSPKDSALMPCFLYYA